MLELKFVNAAYGKSQVLWDINLNVQDGEAVALMGRNGVGKTTLLRSIVGIHLVTDGRIQFGDELLFQALPAYERARRGLRDRVDARFQRRPERDLACAA